MIDRMARLLDAEGVSRDKHSGSWLGPSPARAWGAWGLVSLGKGALTGTEATGDMVGTVLPPCSQAPSNSTLSF